MSKLVDGYTRLLANEEAARNSTSQAKCTKEKKNKKRFKERKIKSR